MLGSLIGAGLGGLVGALADPAKANFVNPNFINQFSGPLGTATRDSFTFNQDPNRQGAVDFANSQLQGQLGNALSAVDPNRIAAFQNAFINARRPQLETNLQQQKQKLNANISGQGLAGSSSSIFAQGQNELNANQQRQQLLNQGILGGEALANQALLQNLQRFNAANMFSQQDINNRLNAFSTTNSAFNRANAFELQRNNLLNALAQKRAAQSQNKFKNIIGGVVAGTGFGDLLGGSNTLEKAFKLFQGGQSFA